MIFITLQVAYIIQRAFGTHIKHNYTSVIKYRGDTELKQNRQKRKTQKDEKRRKWRLI